jgi:PAS domain S-box-containing protein
MNQTIFAGLIGNAALLLSLGLIYDIVFRRRRVPLPLLHQIASGLAIGGIAVVLMLIPVKWESDLIFDTRTILLGLTGLFFGTLPTLLAMAVAGGYRLNLGGGGALMGVATIISSGLIGLAWRHYRLRQARELSLSEMYVFGVAVHAVMILCMSLLPREIIRSAIGSLALPIILIYPVATALLGDLLTDRQRRHRIDEELIHERALFEAIFNGISDAIVYADVDRNIIRINPGFTSAFGYGIDDLKGKSTAFFYADQEEYEKQGRLRFNLTAAEQKLAYESSYRKKDGAVFPGETLGTVIKSASGSVLGYIGVIRDITRRKRSEQALRESEEQFRGLVEQSIAGIYIIRTASSPM